VPCSERNFGFSKVVLRIFSQPSDGYVTISVEANSAGVLPRSNETFVPVPELLIFIYVTRGVFLALRTGAG
jgi:hypothetical protein